MANAAGEYRFTQIPPGQHTLEFAARGFALAKVPVDVVAGAAARADVNLTIGSLTETVAIRGQRPPAVPAAPGLASPQRVRVGGMVTPVRLIAQTKPEYSAELQQRGVEGSVLIRAVVSKAGSLLNPRVVNTSVDPRLAAAALHAVSQWRYEPALLNGEPVEVVTTITVDFQLEQ